MLEFLRGATPLAGEKKEDQNHQILAIERELAMAIQRKSKLNRRHI
jgi:hypothetical protein